MQLEKVTIKDDNYRGFKNINLYEFEEGKHELYGVKKLSPKEKLIEQAKGLGIETDGLTVPKLKKAIKEVKNDNN